MQLSWIDSDGDGMGVEFEHEPNPQYPDATKNYFIWQLNDYIEFQKESNFQIDQNPTPSSNPKCHTPFF